MYLRMVVHTCQLTVPQIIKRPEPAIELWRVRLQCLNPAAPPAPGLLVAGRPCEIKNAPQGKYEAVQDVVRRHHRIFFKPEVPTTIYVSDAACLNRFIQRA